MQLLVWVPLIVTAQNPSFSIETPTLIPTTAGRITSECYLAIDPSDSSRLLAVYLSTKISPDNYDYKTEVLLSTDRGEAWTKITPEALPEAADPWGIIASDGSIVLMDISEGNRFHLTTRISKDHGKTWTEPFSHGFGHDHGMLVEDIELKSLYAISTQSGQDPESISSSKIQIAISSDLGKSFYGNYDLTPFINIGFSAKQPILDSEGNLYIPVLARDKVVDGAFERMKTMQNWLIKIDRSANILQPPIFITDLSDNRHHWLLRNDGPDYHDQFHYFFTGNEKSGIFHMGSSDLGASWKAEQRIDSDSATWADLGACAVNKRGDLAVIWAERITPNCYQRKIAISTDGGGTFTKARSLSQQASCPDESNDWVRRAWPQGGDYCGLVAVSTNQFMALWSAAPSGKFQLFKTIITIED